MSPKAQGKSSKSTRAIKPVKVASADLDDLVDGSHPDPHTILGPHLGASGVTIRVLRPHADDVTVITDTVTLPLTHEHRGVWVGVLAADAVPDYRLDVTYTGEVIPGDDPYRFLPTLGELDLHLISEGRHEELWRVLGAHVHTYPSPFGDVTGVSFAVWAPSALGARVTGSFNHWDGRAHPMRSLAARGSGNSSFPT